MEEKLRGEEKVTGLTYEGAVASLLFEPLGLSHNFFVRNDVMTRRFAVGPNLGVEALAQRQPGRGAGVLRGKPNPPGPVPSR